MEELKQTVKAIEGKDFIKPKDLKFLQEIKDKGIITEQEINLICRRLNNKGKYTIEHITFLFDLPNDSRLKITQEQTEKGLNWLKDKWKTPKGIERKNNPFGYREEEAIKTFKEFKLIDFHNNINSVQASYNISNYVPIYAVMGKTSSFQYYLEAGKPIITG